jgi:DNA-binding transcriptional LysR family regulator
VLAVRRCGSFRAAAEALSITQPSVSARVQHAEALLGVALFHRTTRKVSSTQQGERLCEYAERALYDLRMLTATFRDESSLRGGKVLVGATPTLAATLCAEVIGAFASRRPGVEVQIVDDFFGRSLDRLITGEADFAVTPSISAGAQIELEQIGQEEIVVLARKGHRLVKKRECDLRSTLAAAAVFVSSQSSLSELVHGTYAAQGLVAPSAVTTQNQLSAIAIVLHSDRFTFVPKGVLKVLNLDELATSRLGRNGLFRPICLARARERVVQPGAQALMEAFREKLASKSGTLPE